MRSSHEGARGKRSGPEAGSSPKIPCIKLRKKE